MKHLLFVLALVAALFAPAFILTSGPAFADGPKYCFTKALNGDTIDPPMCGTAVAHSGSGALSCPPIGHPDWTVVTDASGAKFCRPV